MFSNEYGQWRSSSWHPEQIRKNKMMRRMNATAEWERGEDEVLAKCKEEWISAFKEARNIELNWNSNRFSSTKSAYNMHARLQTIFYHLLSVPFYFYFFPSSQHISAFAMQVIHITQKQCLHAVSDTPFRSFTFVLSHMHPLHVANVSNIQGDAHYSDRG